MASSVRDPERAEELGQLIKERRLDLGLNRPAFVAQMGKLGQDITPDYLNKLERGTASLARASLEVREAIRGVLGYSREEWREATGLFVPDALESSTATPHTEVRPVLNLHRVPVRGMAAAGAAFYSDDNILDYEYVADDEYRVGMLAVQIEGDSMEPTIPDGSRVYVDSRQTDPQDGKMFLIHVHGNGFIVKRAKAVADTWLLLSDNPTYPALTPDEATVVGQVYFVQPRGWRT